MKIFKEAKNEMAYAKVGLLGFAGAGKTYTATEIAVGLGKLIKTKKPIAFIDTETGSDYVKPNLEKEGLGMVVAKTRAFQDLLSGVREAEENCDILIVDSISHIWNDLIESYLKKSNKKRLAFQDWNVIKPTWRQFTDLYLTSKVHVIICGRAAWEWDYFKNDAGEMELYKTGTKMRAETEFGYEPSLLIEMEKMRENKHLIHRAYVIKDRAQQLDGQSFDNPKFKEFLPHFQFLALGGEHVALDMTRTSEDMFEPETGKPEWQKRREMIAIALEEIEGEMVKAGLSGQGKEEKKNKITMLEYLFGIHSWTSISSMSYEKLQAGLDELRVAIASKEHMEEILTGEMEPFQKLSKEEQRSLNL